MRKLKRSIENALRGIRLVYREEANFRFHIISAVLALALAWVLRFNTAEWFVVALITVLMLVLEIVNSVFERVADMVKPGVHEYVRDMKDMMAAAVFLMALLAIGVGVTLYLPKLIERFM